MFCLLLAICVKGRSLEERVGGANVTPSHAMQCKAGCSSGPERRLSGREVNPSQDFRVEWYVCGNRQFELVP